MSKKLLMVRSDDTDLVYKEFTSGSSHGQIVITGFDELGIEGEYGYLKELKGDVNYDAMYPQTWEREFKIAEYDEETGKFVYTIYSNPYGESARTSEVKFSIDKLLGKVVCNGVTYQDRLYWDDARQEYMIEANTRYERATDFTKFWFYNGATDGSHAELGYRLDTTIDCIGYDFNSSRTDIKINRRTLIWANSQSESYRVQGILPWNDANSETIIVVTATGSPYWREMTDEQKSTFVKNLKLRMLYPIETEIIPTGIKKKIKIPIFGNGTQFIQKHDDGLYYQNEIQGYQTSYGDMTIEVPCYRAIKYIECSGSPATIPVDVQMEGYKRASEPAYVLSFTGNSDLSTRNEVKYLHYEEDGMYIYPITITDTVTGANKIVNVKLDQELLGPNDTCYWDDEKGRYMISRKTGIFLVDDSTAGAFDGTVYQMFPPNIEKWSHWDVYNQCYAPITSPVPISTLKSASINTVECLSTNWSCNGIYYWPYGNDISVNPFHFRYNMIEEIIETNITKKIEIKMLKNDAEVSINYNNMTGSVSIAVPIISVPNIQYIDITGENIEVPNVINGYKVRHEMGALLKEIYGDIQINKGENVEPYFLYSDNIGDSYKYNITSTSVSNKSKKKTASLLVNQNLVRYYVQDLHDYTDKLYWDTDNTYKVRKNAQYTKFVGADNENWQFWSSDARLYYIKVEGHPSVSGPASTLLAHASVNKATFNSTSEAPTTGTYVFGCYNTDEFGYGAKMCSTVASLKSNLASYPLHAVYPKRYSGGNPLIDTGVTTQTVIPLFKGGTIVGCNTEHLSAKITISVPVEAPPVESYVMFDGETVNVVDIGDQTIANNKEAYLMEIVGDAFINNTAGDYVATPTLIFTDNGDGTYTYNLSQKSISDSSVTTLPIVLPKQLVSVSTKASIYYADRFYWDDLLGEYVIEKYTEYLYYDKHGDNWSTISFWTDWRDWFWQISVQPDNPGAHDHNTGVSVIRSNMPTLWWEGVTSNNGVAAFSQRGGNIFYYDNRVSKSVLSWDALDAHLASKPLHIFYLKDPAKTIYEGNKGCELIRTGIKKLISVTLHEGGTTYSMGNTMNARIRLAVPVKNAVEKLPEATYAIYSRIFAGVAADVIDTGIKLFDEARDFTIMIDFTTTQATNNIRVFHCVNEASPYPGVEIKYSSGWFITGGNNTSNARVHYYNTKLAPVSNRYRYVMRFKQGVCNRIIDCITGQPVERALVANLRYSQNSSQLTIGAARSTTGTYSNYFNGTINKFVLWKDVDLTDAQMNMAIHYSEY